MKEKYLLKFNMFNRVSEMMNNHRQIWESLPQAVTAVDHLNRNLQEIHTLKLKSARNVSPLLAQLVRNRKKLTGQLVPVFFRSLHGNSGTEKWPPGWIWERKS